MTAISEDGNFLFVMNLNTRQLMRIKIPKNDNTLQSSDITFYQITDIPSFSVGGALILGGEVKIEIKSKN